MEGIGKSEQETLAETFVGITSSTREEALFFLESHNWQLESSIQSFFESHQEQVLLPQHNTTTTTTTTTAGEEEEYYATPPEIFHRPPAMMTGSREDRSRKKKKTAASGSGSKIRTLSDMNRGSESDSDIDDGPQEFYTSGEKSGMLVQDPSSGGHDVDSIFDQARQMAAMQEPFEHQPSSSSRNFTGTGRLLSGETIAAAPQQPPENVVHDICFWTNGFTVNDGPLRRFDDPDNAPFLESIRRSECPKELEPEDRRTAIHCNLIRRAEKSPELVKPPSPFQGVGRTLGSATDLPATESAAVVATTASSSAAGSLVVDDSLPSTSIQLRLADGTRTVARFNTHHTVADIRAFIDNLTSSRHRGPTAYTLQNVGFPPKQLTDLTRTIQQEGLANSVVIQKL